jgi:PAS domain-containing protein
MLVANSHLELPENRVIDPSDYFQNIAETVREPLVVLDSDLRALGASRSFYQTFNVTLAETEGCLIYELGDRQWSNSSYCARSPANTGRDIISQSL